MFGRSIKLFNLFGFEVRIDLSWIVIAVLITWSLAAGFFPYLYHDFSTETYWLMGVIGALGLFLSIIFHEFCHSIVARRFGMQMKSITLFIFGGVAEMGDEPPSAKAEFLMAIAGPLSSIFIGAIFYLIYIGGMSGGWPLPVNGVTRYLAYINVLLAAFNLLPAFPLDGGRVLRSILWGTWNDLRRATRVSATIGSTFGIVLIVLGIFQFIGGNFIGAIFYLIYIGGMSGGWPLPVNGVTRYLAYINVLLAAFNLLPAFPLDGGRVLRSILWGTWSDLRRATRVSAAIGSAFGILLIFLGVLQFLRENFIGGLWLFLIGMFLRGAAQMSYQQLLVRNALEGEPVRRFMNPNPVTVPSSITVEQPVEDYIYKYHFKMFPVLDNGRLVGYITTQQVKEVPRENWSRETIGELVRQSSPENTISPETDAIKALALMNQTGNSRLLVVEGTQLVGILTLKDLMNFFSLKVELEK